MNRIRFTAATIQDLEEIYNYIAVDNIKAAERLIAKFRKQWHALADNPSIGHKRDDLEKNLRSSAVGSYVIFYHSVKCDIEIVRVMHSSRNIEKHFQA